MNLLTRCLPAVVILAGLVGCGSPAKYDETKHDASTAATEASGYWKKDGWWSLPKEASKKIAIAEFTVEYVTNRDAVVGDNQLGLLTVARIAGAGRREYAFDDTLKGTLPSELYESFVSALQQKGYEVVPMSQVAATKGLQSVKVGESGVTKGGGYSHGFTGGDGKQKFEIYPVVGLPRIKDGMFDAGKNAQGITSMMAEVGADTALRVHMRVGLHKGQATAEAGSTISVISGLKAVQNKDKTDYWAKVYGSLHSSRTMYFPDSVVDSKEYEAFKGDVYQVNSSLYRPAVSKLMAGYSVMAVEQIK